MLGMNALGQNGRLGNQMFQFASLVGIAKNMGYDYCIPDHSKALYFDKMEGDEIITVNHQLQHLFQMKDVKLGTIEDGNDIRLEQAEFCEDLFKECPDNSTLYGYFESYHYFENVEKELRELFTFDPFISMAARGFHIGTEKPVALNVRRGKDFIRVQDFHPPCSEVYYKEAIERLGKDRQYVVIADDMEWCKETFKGDNYIFNDTVPDGMYKGHYDLAVGAMCDDFIISNSTFSWWMAYLGTSETKKVYAPDPWFGPALKDIDTEGYYPEWIEKIEREIVRV